jgi:tetratricopeptide (TPR) repeat protein
VETQLSAEDHFQRGNTRLATNELRDALEHFREAHQLEPHNALYKSHYGLLLGLVEQRHERAIVLCRAALAQDSFDVDLYRNLARAYLASGRKRQAIRFLRGGLVVEPQSQELRQDLLELGVRRRRVIPFLSRRNPLNRVLGRVRWRLRQRRAAPATPAFDRALS